ncbi:MULTISPECIES: ribbon-helix-helix protein, CopG family [Mycobacteriaceae]|uniref:Ribbon-helix-helix protein, CopG family n=2 Tax=Mycolicibacter TaxID=1073531 RepID=A0A9X7WE62_9MYCO|nr:MULTISPECIES: ribbon-helix-helix protein, CopG family [Mycobacteriaceae]KAA1429964.1 ribbon-helix-helix protein, CopG family [Mycolicibacter arupensis]MBL3748839.1 ribbon-helix-helix protein, CopG family [Mycobacteroides abscessus subsp. massiliense]MEB3063250.1 ribbon-helix-helix protein, CopG family [Mycolicibacter sp. MYC101]QZA06227.1 ribbon-helix-helix protein, CopG family [Mycolicibacter heraklionensis]TXI56382.1 MAG: ribbon-helix-helix protein, CopG family [Mycolicibacter arupensis]
MNNELSNLLNEARELEAVDSSEYTTAPATHPNREKAQTLTVRLTDDEMTRLRTAAAERRLPVSAVVRTAIAHELAPQPDDGTRELITALHDHNLAIVRTAK